MRRVRYSVAMSLDGYIMAPGGAIDWIPRDPDIDFAAQMSAYDAAVMGRKTYELARGMGPNAGLPGLDVTVISRSLRPADCPGVTVSDDARGTVDALKRKPGKDIWLFGGGELFRSLLAAGLVDSVQTGVVPIVLGGGVPFLPAPAPRARLTLTGHRVYPKTGTVMLEYSIVAGG